MSVATELLAEIEEIDLRRCELLEELGEIEQVKRSKLVSLDRVLETQKEEFKISTIAEFEGHLKRGTLDKRKATTTFDNWN